MSGDAVVPLAPGLDPVIELRGLEMTYGAVRAVRGVDLAVAPGEVYAFLGPNGAGKTSTVEVMEGFRRRTGGDVRVLGEDPAHAGAKWRARIGVVLQESSPEPELRVAECLELYAGYYPAPRDVDEVLGLVGLAESARVRCGALSGGQRRRLDVALALVGDPDLLFLDEPTTGFDPQARRAAWDVIDELRRLGKTVFLTTHYMEEAERLADRIGVIAAGRVVAEGVAAEVGERAARASTVRFVLPRGVAVADLPGNVTVSVVDAEGGAVLASTLAPLALVGELAEWSRAHDVTVTGLEVAPPTLEDVYLELTTESP